MEEWQEDRMNFYSKSGVLKFIDDYFDVEKGVRCIIGHVKDMYKLKKNPTYRIYENNECRALTIPDFINGKYNILAEFYCVHSLMYIFNKQVLQLTNFSNRNEIMKSSIEGLNAIIDLDSPEESNNDKAKRLTFFDYVNEFNNVINIIDKELQEVGEEYNLMFSGNGIYIILQGYYESNLEDYINNFINILDNIKEKENGNLEDKLKVHVDNKSAPWNDYFKIPFTFHEKRPRVSMPLPKGEIDSEWLDFVSNADNIMNDYSIVDEIIKKSKWNKIW